MMRDAEAEIEGEMGRLRRGRARGGGDQFESMRAWVENVRVETEEEQQQPEEPADVDGRASWK